MDPMGFEDVSPIKNGDFPSEATNHQTCQVPKMEESSPAILSCMDTACVKEFPRFQTLKIAGIYIGSVYTSNFT